MDNESLVKICNSAFTEAEVLEAKTLLFESVNSAQKKVARRSDGKKKRNLEDIISFFKEVDPDSIPVFVARNLQKLPPISVDHVDVVTLLKDVVSLRNDINAIKECYATTRQLQELQMDLENMKLASIVNNHHNVNTRKRGAYLLESGPIGLSPSINDEFVGSEMSADQICNDCSNGSTDQLSLSHPPKANGSDKQPVPFPPQQDRETSPAHEQARLGTRETRATTMLPKQMRSSTMKNDISREHTNSFAMDNRRFAETSEMLSNGQNKLQRLSMADIVRQKGEWTNNGPSEEWKVVQRKRFRNRFIGKTGKAVTDPETKFKAAEIKIPLFISNVDKASSEKDICAYIQSKTNECVMLEKIVMKAEKPYNAFKMFVSQHKQDLYLNDELWPDGIRFRRFVHFKKRVPVQKGSSTEASGLENKPHIVDESQET